MFERYTETARRVIFFARYEASQFGSMTIETEHLLLGLIREATAIVHRFMPAGSAETIRKEISARSTIREKVSTSVDLPLSQECKRILAYAAEEAERLNHRHIGNEHLLLGMMREENCFAAELLRQRGLELDALREEFVRIPMAFTEVSSVDLHRSPTFDNPVLPKAGVVPDADTAMRIAEAVWTPLYGAETIQSQMPLTAELKFNIWTVTGAAASPGTEALFAVILQADGRILSVGRGAP
jgi:hypothetical protein